MNSLIRKLVLRFRPFNAISTQSCNNSVTTCSSWICVINLFDKVMERVGGGNSKKCKGLNDLAPGA